MSKKRPLTEGQILTAQKGFNKPTTQSDVRPTQPPPAPKPQSQSSGGNGGGNGNGN